MGLEGARPNYLGCSYKLSPTANGYGKMLELTTLVSATFSAQVHMGLGRWIWNHSKLNTYKVDNCFRLYVGSHGFFCLFLYLLT